MLSPLFWLSLFAVFWGVKTLAEGLMSLGNVEVRRAFALRETPGKRSAPVPVRPSGQRKPMPAELDRAA